jgi:hypothetical protein
MVPKRLSDNAFYSVSARCGMAVLFRDGKAQTRFTAIVMPAQNGKPFVSAAGSFFEHAPVSRSVQHPIILAKSVR